MKEKGLSTISLRKRILIWMDHRKHNWNGGKTIICSGFSEGVIWIKKKGGEATIESHGHGGRSTIY